MSSVLCYPKTMYWNLIENPLGCILSHFPCNSCAFSTRFSWSNLACWSSLHLWKIPSDCNRCDDRLALAWRNMSWHGVIVDAWRQLHLPSNAILRLFHPSPLGFHQRWGKTIIGPKDAMIMMQKYIIAWIHSMQFFASILILHLYITSFETWDMWTWE